METKASPRAANATITSTLAEYIAKAGATALPPAVVEKAKHHILDTLAACVSGAQLAAGVRAIAYIEAEGGSARAAVTASWKWARVFSRTWSSSGWRAIP